MDEAAAMPDEVYRAVEEGVVSVTGFSNLAASASGLIAQARIGDREAARRIERTPDD